MSSASCVENTILPNPVLVIFNLHTHEAALARALRETNATIHGGSALCWYTNSIPTLDQDIDIWCQPTSEMTEADIVARINAVIEPAGYTNRNPETICACGSGETCELCFRTKYLYMGSNSITAVHEWRRHWSYINTRKIQLIIRNPHITTSPVAEFDLDIATLCVAPHPEEDRLIMLEPNAELADRIRRHVMRIGNLCGQMLDNKHERINKYYDRGYAFESADGSRLTQEEAIKYIKSSWIAANPLPESDPHRADNLRSVLATQPLTQETPTSILNQLNSTCREALHKPQNAAVYPSDTRWINEYRNTVKFLLQSRKLIEDWDTASVRKITNYEWIERNICRCYGTNIVITAAKREAFPAHCEQLDRVYSEALHILAGAEPDDRVRPALPIPPKKVVNKL